MKTKAHDIRRQRPWLLLWLLPYLVFSLGNNSFHNHFTKGFGAGKADQTTQVAVHPLHAGAQTGNHTDCVACQWVSSSAAFTATQSVTQARAIVRATAVRPKLALSSVSSLTPPNRGPPSA